MLTFATVKKHGPAARPHHDSMSGTSRPQHPQVRHILRVPSVQPKLTVGAPNDKFEQEADRVADKVMRMREPSGVEPTPSNSKIQRLCEGCEKEIRRQPLEEEEELLQPKRISPNEGLMLGAETQSRVAAVRQGGAPLPANTRNFFEPRFGHDFSAVRVHTDRAAADAALSVNAQAYTLGRDIVFGSGQYGPNTPSGKQLLAHELTHVVQQNGGRNLARRSPARGTESEQQHAVRTPKPQIHTVLALEDEQRLQRNEDEGTPAQAPAAPTSPAVPSLNFGATGTTLTRGDTLTASVSFTANAGESMIVTRWRYITPGHGTVIRPIPQAQAASKAQAFQSSWSGTMAVSGNLEMQYTITPSGGQAGAPQTLVQALTVNNRTGTNWQSSSVTNVAEGILSGKPSPPRVFSDLGHHATSTSQPNPTTSRIADGPNRRFTFVTSMAAGTYTSTPTIHPDLTAATSSFKIFHSDPSILFLVVGTTKTRIPNSEYSALSVGGGLSFSVPSWETFYKAHTFYRVRATTVRATGQNTTVTVRDAWWGLANNAMNANVTITNDTALRTALAGGSGSYSGSYNVAVTPRGSWEGVVLMQAPAILTGTQSHEYVHATHSHRANFTKMVRALSPRKVLEKTVSVPGHAVNFNNKVQTLLGEILRPNHEIVDEGTSATAESFRAQPGVTMAGVNEDPATGANLGSVWNVHGNAEMTN